MSRQGFSRHLRLVLAAAIGIGGTVALASGAPTQAAGPADAECVAAGYDYGVKLDTSAVEVLA